MKTDTDDQTKSEFNLTPAQKAARINMSESYLAKDRLKAAPEIPFRRYGRTIRYSADE